MVEISNLHVLIQLRELGATRKKMLQVYMYLLAMVVVAVCVFSRPAETAPVSRASDDGKPSGSGISLGLMSVQ